MTRLISEWLVSVEEEVAQWDEKLKKITGLGYVELAECFNPEIKSQFKDNDPPVSVAVVPITSGLGTISSFAESVAAIVKAMGINAFVTKATDIDGIYEAYVNNADIVYVADDDRYIAINLNNRKVGENNYCTAKGFVECLEKMSGDLRGQDVLVLGYGVIGRMMAGFLRDKGAVVTIHEKDIKKKENVIADGFLWEPSADMIKEYSYIADGTSEGDWLNSDMISSEAYLVAPGIPLSLTEDAKKKISGRYVHDLLEIGTVGMLGMVL